MTPNLLRLAYICEFLVALVAIFSSWSEIGGQAALDLMYWGWKFGLGFGMAASVVGYTAALVGEESWWTLRSARWLLAVLVIGLVMGALTYFYALQVDTGADPDENATMSWLGAVPLCGLLSAAGSPAFLRS